MKIEFLTGGDLRRIRGTRAVDRLTGYELEIALWYYIFPYATSLAPMGVSRTWEEGNRSLRDLPKQWRNTWTKKALPLSGGDLIVGFGENLGGWKSGELFEFNEVGQKAALWRACLPLQGSETSQLLLSGIRLIIIFVVLLHLLSRIFSSKLRWDITHIV